jgi:triacylglycerol lipase
MLLVWLLAVFRYSSSDKSPGLGNLLPNDPISQAGSTIHWYETEFGEGDGGMFSSSKAIFLAGFCRQAYRQLDSGTVMMPAGYRLVQGLSTFYGGNNELFGFIAESRQSIVIAFRGTQLQQSPFDIFADLDLAQIPYPYVGGAGTTHRGFTRLYGRLRRRILETLKKRSSRKRLRITGHSLGGALATLCAIDVAANSKFPAPIVYTIGSPRVGDAAFCNAFNRKVKNSWRIYNENDLVPRVPSRTYVSPITGRVWQYEHVNSGYRLEFQNGSLLRNHDLTNYFTALCRLNTAYCRKLCSGNPGYCPA